VKSKSRNAPGFAIAGNGAEKWKLRESRHSKTLKFTAEILRKSPIREANIWNLNLTGKSFWKCNWVSSPSSLAIGHADRKVVSRPIVLAISRERKRDWEREINTLHGIIREYGKSSLRWSRTFVAVPARWHIISGPIEFSLRCKYWIIESVKNNNNIRILILTKVDRNNSLGATGYYYILANRISPRMNALIHMVLDSNLDDSNSPATW
jgi:hypothetical protein